jgi:23S rRNA (uracil1939-C5)-methyltransferase
MARFKKEYPVLEKIEILDAGSEGKAVARVDKLVVFVPFVVPGDIVDIKVLQRKKSFYEGKAIKFHHLSERRVEPRCEHFGLCGGCKWQNLNYNDQLFYKQKQVFDNFTRLGKFEFPEILPIIPAPAEYFYRNKLEFTCSNRKWLVEHDKNSEVRESLDGIGFHLIGMFDRIIDLKNCYLQPKPSNQIRLALRKFALDNHFDFYDTKAHQGFLRNLIIRTASTGELMVIVVFAGNEQENIKNTLEFIANEFPKITSLMYVINTKKNDTINDQEILLYKGTPHIFEEMEGLRFKIGPISFYQTNSTQAHKLYQVAREFAGFNGSETVYDLYCGTGTITNFIAKSVKKAIGIEYVPSAIEDAINNAAINKITNTHFVTGDIAKTLNEEFFAQHGKPDIIITDPPRSGMHPKVIEEILNALPEKLVYVSCNPATQARDIALMQEHYDLAKIQPVDMFPQTHHVENICLLVRKKKDVV